MNSNVARMESFIYLLAAITKTPTPTIAKQLLDENITTWEGFKTYVENLAVRLQSETKEG